MDVDRMLGKAAEEAKRKNFDYAIRLYQELLGLKPDLVAARKGLHEAARKKHGKKYPSKLSATMKGLGPLISIRLQKAMKKHHALLSSCEKYLQHDPQNLGVLETLGDAAVEAGFTKTGILVYEEITEIHGDYADGYKTLGDLYHANGQIDEALEAYENALKIRPNDADVEKARKNLAAEGAIRSSGIDRADSARSLAKDEDELRKLESKKRLVKSAKEIADDITEAEEALKKDPENVASIRNLAELYYQKGDVDEAIEVLEEALEIQPDSEDTRIRVGDWKLRRSRDRIAALKEEGNAVALGRALDENKQLRVEEYRRRVEARPTDAKSRYHLGTALLDAGKIDDAIGEFQQTIRDPKHRLESQLKLGDCFFRKKMYDLAAKQLKEALEATAGAGPRELEILYTLGQVYEAMGETKDALATYSRVYERDIQYEDVAARIEALNAAD